MWDYEAEYRLIIEKGLLDPADLPALRERAHRLGVSPLSLLSYRPGLDSENENTLGPGQNTAGDNDSDTLNGDQPTDWEITLDSQALPPPTDAKSSFPFPTWDRFQIVGFIGRGGMGRVFRANDPRLKRDVAIKIVDSPTAQGQTRFVREARVQAGVHHPHICQVYEAGEVQGHTYIAMKYIDGVSLAQAAEGMNLEQKLILCQQVALGLHEAHRHGLIHRDIKPANLMVQEREDGTLHAYILDFGLARDLNETGLTQTGEMMGTPAFMAPEQAVGRLDQVDRRTDIYSLGATLYKILSGTPPVRGDNMPQMLHNLIHEDTTPLRRIAPAVPKDVETIIMKALAPKSSERYDSASALADDLGRYLNGEPIHARSIGLIEWVVHKARRHRGLVRLGLTAVVLLIFTLGWALSLRRQGRLREELTRDFTTRVEKIEALGRYMHMAPPHQLEPERVLIRQRMSEIETRMDEFGKEGMGPGHYSLGLGYLVLNKPKTAHQHLQQAWQTGYREARVALALSRTLGALYREGLTEADRIQKKKQRRKKLEEIERLYRDPALTYARLAKAGDTGIPGFNEAQIAFYEKRYDEAIRLLEAREGYLSWNYEPYQLIADVHMAQADTAADDGNYEIATQEFERARQSYEQALEIAPSDPALNLARARVDHALMKMEMYRGGELEGLFQKSQTTMEKLLVLDPNWDLALLRQASFYQRYSEYLTNFKKEGARDWLERAAGVVQPILEVDPSHPKANDYLGRTHRYLARLDMEQGLDPTHRQKLALEALSRVPTEDRNANYYNELGLLHKMRTEYAEGRGEETAPYLQAEIAALDKAILFDKKNVTPLINKAGALLRLAHGHDMPEQILSEGITTLRTAWRLKPDHIATCFYMGRLSIALAEEKNKRGGDPKPDFKRAERFFKKGSELSPKLPHFPTGLGGLYYTKATLQWSDGEDPMPTVQTAIDYFTRVQVLAPNHGPSYFNLGNAYGLRAHYKLFAGQDPETDVRQTLEQYKRALNNRPDFPDYQAALGQILTVRAAYMADQGVDPGDILDEAQGILKQVTALQPMNGSIDLYSGTAAHIRAKWLFKTNKPFESNLASAIQSFQRAQTRDIRRATPELARALFQGSLWRMKRGRPPGDYPEAVLIMIEKMLSEEEQAELLIIRGVLKRLLSGTDQTKGNVGLKDIERGLKLNQNLRYRWSPILEDPLIAVGDLPLSQRQ